MEKKVDKNLKAALDKAVKKKQKLNNKSINEQSFENRKRAAHIKKWMPKAKAWIKNKLFNMITEAEAEGCHYILLSSFYEDGIPTEVIYEAAKNVKGLRPIYKSYVSERTLEVESESYSIEWDSTDPNDNRND